MKKSKFYIFLFCFLPLFFSCDAMVDFNASMQSYYMPDLDIFVVRSSNPNWAYKTINNESPETFIKRSLTEDGPDGINHYLKQVGVSLHHSRIRIFYIKPPLNDTMLGTFHRSKKFTLTNNTGEPYKGSVYNKKGPLKIYMANYESQGYANQNGASGKGVVGDIGVLILSLDRGYKNMSFSKIVSHELGHNFRLLHPFLSNTEKNDQACEPSLLGRTNKVMDYGTLEVFSPCERIVVSRFVKERFKEKTAYYPDRPPLIETYTGDWEGTIDVH